MTFRRIARDRTVLVVRLDHQHARTAAIEADDVRLPELSAVETERIRSDASGQRDLIDHLLAEPRDLQHQLAVLLVPRQREEAVHALKHGCWCRCWCGGGCLAR